MPPALCWGLLGDNEVHYKTVIGNINRELGWKLVQAHRGKLILGFPSLSERQTTGELGRSLNFVKFSQPRLPPAKRDLIILSV